MDLETYIARYNGATRLQRLLLIAQQTQDEAVASQAFGLAETQMKEERNTQRYKEVFGYSSSATAAGSTSDTTAENPDAGVRRPPPSSFSFDEAWNLNTEASNRETGHILQGRLSTAQSHMHKEAIRTAYVAIAKHSAKTGKRREALSSLLRAMDYCTSRSQTAQLAVLLLEAAFGVQSYQQVREYVTKMEHTLSNTSVSAASASSPTAASPGSIATADLLQDVSVKLKIASGLERMAQGDYSAAASIFTKLIMTNGGAAKLEWPGVTCAEDISLYASLLALATQDRSQILELAEHPEALELVPAMKELLLQWARANYVKCMQAFSQDCSMSNSTSEVNILQYPDLYLSAGDKWEKLSKKIREKCLLEYLRPYQCIQLSKMSKLFPSIPDLQDELVDLMGRGLLSNAKIDARANILYKNPPSHAKPSVDMYRMEQRVLDDTHAMLIRLACMEYDLCVSDGMGSHRHASRSRRAAAQFANQMMGDDDGDDSSVEDTPMLDVDVLSARNPEDMY